LLTQGWYELTFIHWIYPAETVRTLVPAELELDLFEGKAYVGLVPFVIRDLTLAGAPSVPWLSHFEETNVRTYVRDGSGRRGVWFFSLDAARLAAVAGARIGFALPYYWARMRLRREGDLVHYFSRRRHGGPAESDLRVRIGDPIEVQSAREVFLTGRWRLWARRGGSLFRCDVEHPRWPLHRASLAYCRQSLLQAAGFPEPEGEPLVHFSSGVRVFMTGLHRNR
jgi:uncharacterized protein YqjF (DUF2071 family)